jgi:hypothetical protein
MLTLDQMVELLDRHHQTDLLRLETLPWYAVESDGDDYRRWLDDQPPAVDKSGWLDTLRRDTAAGKAWRRVRVLHDPLTPYERYQIDCCYGDNNAAGEQVRILEGGDYDRLVGDFFVVEHGDLILRAVYDTDGTWLGATTVPQSAEYGALLAVADLAWTAAKPWDRWVSDYQRQNAA